MLNEAPIELENYVQKSEIIKDGETISDKLNAAYLSLEKKTLNSLTRDPKYGDYQPFVYYYTKANYTSMTSPDDSSVVAKVEGDISLHRFDVISHDEVLAIYKDKQTDERAGYLTENKYIPFK